MIYDAVTGLVMSLAAWVFQKKQLAGDRPSRLLRQFGFGSTEDNRRASNVESGPGTINCHCNVTHSIPSIEPEMVSLSMTSNSHVSKPTCQWLDTEFLRLYAHVVLVGYSKVAIKTPVSEW